MKILFVCTGNTCRSPMAEGILKDLKDKYKLDVEVKSAGVFASQGFKASENAIKAMEDIGVDISNHRSRLVDKDLITESDLVLTMSKTHKKNLLSFYPAMKTKIFTLYEYASNKDRDVTDPYGFDKDFYVKIRDELFGIIDSMIKEKKIL